MLTARQAAEKAIVCLINQSIERGSFICFPDAYIDKGIITLLKEKGYKVITGNGSENDERVLIKSIYW